MSASDLGLVGPYERAALDDELAADVEAVDAVRPGEDEAGHGIGRSGELERLVRPYGKVGAHAGRDRADVGPAEDARAAAGAEPDRLACRHRVRPAASACDEESLLHLEKEVAALVRRGAVDAETDADAHIHQLAHRRDAGSEAEVRGGAVRDPGPRRGEAGDLRGREVDAMSAPDVAVQPAESVEVLDRRAAVELLARRLLLDRLGEVG